MLLSLFNRGGVRADAGGDRSVWGGFWFEGIGAAGGARVSGTQSLALPAVWACISLLSKSFAVMPFELFEPQQSGARKKRRDHWLYRLMTKKPNRFQSAFEWRMMLMAHLGLRGNAFCQITDDGRGKITELLPLHPDRMQAEVLESGDYRYRYTDQNGKVIIYLRSEIWHIRWLSYDGIVGLSPIESAREAVGEALSMQSYAARFYANDARPAGVIQYDGKFTSNEAKKNFRDGWREAYGGRNQRSVAVLEKGMTYHEMKLSNADAQFVEARKEKVSEIARIWGIPPHKIGDLSRATNNNIEHQNIEFWSDCMHPYGKCFSSSAEFALLGEDSGLDAEFDVRPMMLGDGKARAERISALVLGGVMIPNEGREQEGLDPVPGLDRPLRPLNMGMVEEDGSVEAPEPPEMPGAPEDDPAEPADPADPQDGADAKRLQTILAASAGRLARRAAGALAKKSAADVFGAEFQGLMAESLGVSAERAGLWCDKFQAAVVLDEETIASGLLACAAEA